MFTRKDQLNKKGGPEERFSYLKQLRHEFETTKSYEAKRQVLANLSNFAYDPINFEFIKRLKILDIFLAQLSENSEELLLFAVGGLCNLCLDPENAEYIIKHNGIYLISELLAHRNEEIALNAFTTLIYMCTPETQNLFVTPDIINAALNFQNTDNKRFKNLGTIFLEDFCTKAQIDSAKQNESS